MSPVHRDLRARHPPARDRPVELDTPSRGNRGFYKDWPALGIGSPRRQRPGAIKAAIRSGRTTPRSDQERLGIELGVTHSETGSPPQRDREMSLHTELVEGRDGSRQVAIGLAGVAPNRLGAGPQQAAEGSRPKRARALDPTRASLRLIEEPGTHRRIAARLGRRRQSASRPKVVGEHQHHLDPLDHRARQLAPQLLDPAPRLPPTPLVEIYLGDGIEMSEVLEMEPLM